MFAQNGHSLCTSLFKLATNAEKSPVQNAPLLSSLPNNRLEEVLKEFNLAPPLALKGATIPKKLVVGDQSFPVVRELGRGADGIVYEVIDGKVRRAVKHFWSKGFAKPTLAKFEKFNQAGFRTPNIFKIDNTRKTMLFEFIEGVPCDFFDKSKVLSLGERAQAEKDYSAFWSQARKFGELESQNVILETSSGEYVVIDP